MRNKSQFIPQLDRLEDRTCPAMILRHLPTVTILSGTPTAALTVTGVGGSKFEIKDGTKSLGTYAIQNLQVNLLTYKMPITMDLNGQKIPGNILVARGNGNLDALDQPLTINDGTVGGSITLTGGRGRELVELGVAGGGVGNTLRVGGNVTVVGRNGALGDGDDFRIHDGSSVGGSVTINTTPATSIGDIGGAGSVIGRNLIVNNAISSRDSGVAINKDSTVGGNVTLIGSGVLLVSGDNVTVEDGARISGNFVANLGNNVNLFLLAGTYDGNVFLYGGSGSSPVAGIATNTVEFDDALGNEAKIAGSVLVNTASSTAIIFDNGATVAGDMTLNLLGNDENEIGAGGAFLGAIFAGEVSGNLAIRTGNGDNFFTLDAAATVMGKVSYVSGNGVNKVTVNNAGTFNLDLVFGSGDDTLTFGLGSQINSLKVKFGAGTDSLVDNGVTILSSVSISDLP